MMNLPDDLLTVFSARIESRDGSTVIELPRSELELGELEVNDSYRVAILKMAESDSARSSEATTSQHTERPVREGEVREVEIEGIGEQGDGIARVGQGYVLFVPGTDVGDAVTVEIAGAHDNFGFAEVIKEESVAPQ